MSASECTFSEERLPLLLYPGELSPDEEQRVRTHLLACAGCRAQQEEVEATSSFLDQAPAPLPAALAGVKARVLLEVGAAAPCPHEVELLDDDRGHASQCPSCGEARREFVQVGRALDLLPAPALGADAAEVLRARILAAVGQPPCPREAEVLWEPDAAHLAECASCQVAAGEFAAVGRALDRVPVGPPDPQRWSQLSSRIDAELGVKAGRVLRFPAWAVRLAAAVLIATTLGLTAYTIVDRPGVGPAKVDRILAEADALVRTGDEAVLPEALERFKQLAETKDAHVASRARYEALGLTRLQTRRRPRAVSTSAAVYVTPQARERARAREMLISYKDVLVEFPGTRASLFAIKRALPSSEQEVFKFDFGGMKAGNRAHQLRMNTLLARRDEVLRVDYSKMRQLDHLVELDPQLLNNPRLRQSILLQRALQAKELSAIASSRLERTKLREDARKDLQTLIRLDPESKAAQLAREALATI